MAANNWNKGPFWSRVEKTDSCWLWTGGRSSGKGKKKYGSTLFYGKVEGTHRVAWMLTYGTIPKDKWVLHKCNNMLCVNPEHLYLGDATDNARDRRGPNHWKTQLGA